MSVTLLVEKELVWGSTNFVLVDKDVVVVIFVPCM